MCGLGFWRLQTGKARKANGVSPVHVSGGSHLSHSEELAVAILALSFVLGRVLPPLAEFCASLSSARLGHLDKGIQQQQRVHDDTAEGAAQVVENPVQATGGSDTAESEPPGL